jgi:hypothetical protein
MSDSLEVIRTTISELKQKVQNVSKLTQKFTDTSTEILTYVNSNMTTGSIHSITVSDLVSPLSTYFQYFVSLTDEIMILINGAVTNKQFHYDEHKPFFHYRNVQMEKKYYNACNDISRCSVDGMEYEYGVLKNMKLKSRLTDVSVTNSIFICVFFINCDVICACI